MIKLLGARVVRLFPVLLAVTFLTTWMFDLIPGDPAREIAGETATEEQIAAVNQLYGFNDPLLVRYGRWLLGFVQGDLGTSFRTKTTVADEIVNRIGVTLEIALLAIVVALVIGIAFAVIASMRPRSAVDQAIGATSFGILSIPGFLLGILLVYVFAIQFGLFPVTGWTAFTDDPGENLRAAALPVLTLALPEAVVIQRILRSELLATFRQDFLLAARAKGGSPLYVTLRHALRPSSFSLLTIVGLSLGRLIGGAIIVETLFALPGIGRLMIQSIQTKDLVVVQGLVVMMAISYLLLNLLVDLLYAVIDPRLRLRRS